MLFTQPIYLVFFAVVLGLAWGERSHRRHKLWLLAASYLFYGWWDWRFLSLIAISTIIDYSAGLLFQTVTDPKRRLWVLRLSLTANLGLLGVFKYFNFFLESASALLGPLGVHLPDRALAIVLPAGISFYTFQTMSYTLDVYRGHLKPVRSLLDFALFVSFFPQLVAGPIVRAADFLPQLVERPRWQNVRVRAHLWLFVVGFIKKSCVADQIAPFVEQVFGQPHGHGTQAVWVAVGLYAAQIYCDFSGYSDMAIASAGLLGYDLCENFRFPYLAANITDFWRRWHISLSTWLRDYLYIPLGGNRGSRLFTYRNLMLTMLLGGLWHGAAWTFVFWGALHGLALVVHREWRRRRGEPATGSTAAVAARRLAAWAGTVYFVCIAWIFFRAGTFLNAATLLRGFVLFDAAGKTSLSPWLILLIAALFALHWLGQHRVLERRVEALPDWLFATGYGTLWALALAFVPLKAEPFIYFQF